MSITFKLLCESHFPLLLKWLKTPHVRAYWDADVQWTPELIQEKYDSYSKGYKLEKGIPKKIQAYIIFMDEEPIGYIQLYNAYDFPRSKPLIGLPENLAALDIFIGEVECLGKNLGSKALQLFLETIADPHYCNVLVDPEKRNIAAIKAYEKAGFKKIIQDKDTEEIDMLRVKTEIK